MNSINGWNSKVNIKLTNSQFNKLKTAVKNKTGLTLRMNIKMFCEHNLHQDKKLSTEMRLKIICQYIQLFKTQISKTIQSDGFLGWLLSKLAGPLMKVAISLENNIFTPLGITSAASAIDAGIQKKIHCSGITTLTISNKEINDIIKIVEALEDSNNLLRGVTKTI